MKSQKNKGGHFAPESQGGKAPHTPGGAFDDAWTDLEWLNKKQPVNMSREGQLQVGRLGSVGLEPKCQGYPP